MNNVYKGFKTLVGMLYLKSNECKTILGQPIDSSDHFQWSDET